MDVFMTKNKVGDVVVFSQYLAVRLQTVLSLSAAASALSSSSSYCALANVSQIEVVLFHCFNENTCISFLALQPLNVYNF